LLGILGYIFSECERFHSTDNRHLTTDN
jgi:hypothetical protein